MDAANRDHRRIELLLPEKRVQSQNFPKISNLIVQSIIKSLISAGRKMPMTRNQRSIEHRISEKKIARFGHFFYAKKGCIVEIPQKIITFKIVYF